jgi:hypothetical protein
MASKIRDKNSNEPKRHPDRHHYAFYVTKYKKKEILALVELGIAPNGNQVLRNALEIYLDKYRHLIQPEIMDKVEKKYFGELDNSSDNSQEE